MLAGKRCGRLVAVALIVTTVAAASLDTSNLGSLGAISMGDSSIDLSALYLSDAAASDYIKAASQRAATTSESDKLGAHGQAAAASADSIPPPATCVDFGNFCGNATTDPAVCDQRDVGGLPVREFFCRQSCGACQAPLPAPCADLLSDCPTVAATNQCATTSLYGILARDLWCRKACGGCADSGPAPPPTVVPSLPPVSPTPVPPAVATPDTIPPPATCEDYAGFCGNVTDNPSLCDQHSDQGIPLREFFCRKSCGACQAPVPAPCKDWLADCSSVAANGQCASASLHGVAAGDLWCRQACGTCGGVTSSPPPVSVQPPPAPVVPTPTPTPPSPAAPPVPDQPAPAPVTPTPPPPSPTAPGASDVIPPPATCEDFGDFCSNVTANPAICDQQSNDGVPVRDFFCRMSCSACQAPVPAPCKDWLADCASVAANGQCAIASLHGVTAGDLWCRQACGTCAPVTPTPPPVAPTPVPAPPAPVQPVPQPPVYPSPAPAPPVPGPSDDGSIPPPATCEDYADFCGNVTNTPSLCDQRSDQGVPVREFFCRRSCGACQAPVPAPCKDWLADCATTAANGQCATASLYNVTAGDLWCRQACGTCGGLTPPPAPLPSQPPPLPAPAPPTPAPSNVSDVIPAPTTCEDFGNFCTNVTINPAICDQNSNDGVPVRDFFCRKSCRACQSPVPAPCKDWLADCAAVAAKGQCASASLHGVTAGDLWCRQACGTCGGAVSPPPLPVPSQPPPLPAWVPPPAPATPAAPDSIPPPAMCEDYGNFCGNIIANPTVCEQHDKSGLPVREFYCRKSCGACQEPVPAPCADLLTDCATVVAKGQCAIASLHGVLASDLWCRQSCGTCSTTTPTTPPVPVQPPPVPVTPIPTPTPPSPAAPSASDVITPPATCQDFGDFCSNVTANPAICAQRSNDGVPVRDFFCRKSCSACQAPVPAPCKDWLADCSSVAASGQCAIASLHGVTAGDLWCRQACGTCTLQPSLPGADAQLTGAQGLMNADASTLLPRLLHVGGQLERIPITVAVGQLEHLSKGRQLPGAGSRRYLRASQAQQ